MTDGEGWKGAVVCGCGALPKTSQRVLLLYSARYLSDQLEVWFEEPVNSKLNNTCVMGVDVLVLHPESLLLCPNFGIMCVTCAVLGAVTQTVKQYRTPYLNSPC